MTQTTYTVADHAKTIPLTVWGDRSLVIGRWYQLTDVSVRLINQTTCLSTTVETTYSIVDDFGSSAKVEQGVRKSIVGEIVDTDIKIQYLCPQFHTLEFVNLETNMARCENCRAYCKTSKVTSLLRGHITVEIEAKKKKIHMDHDNFCNLLGLPTHAKYNSNELVLKVLGHDKLQIDMCGELMINVQFVDNAAEKSMCEAKSSSVPGCHKRVHSKVEIDESIPCTSTASACALSSSECGHSEAVQSDVHIETNSVCSNEKEGADVQDNFDDIDLNLEELEY